MNVFGYRNTAAVLLPLFGALAWAPRPALADAIVSLSGSDSNAGAIDLSTAGGSAFGGEITAGGVTGYSLWGLLGGSPTGSSMTTTTGSGSTITYGGITTFTPTGDNSKNAVL